MRPAGEVRQAVLQAVHELATPDRGGTLKEIMQRACVSYDACRRTIDNMVRAQALRIPRTRVVDYRNRPVAEYEPASVAAAA